MDLLSRGIFLHFNPVISQQTLMLSSQNKTNQTCVPEGGNWILVCDLLYKSHSLFVSLVFPLGNEEHHVCRHPRPFFFFF